MKKRLENKGIRLADLKPYYLRLYIKKVDPEALILIPNTTEITGKGFMA
ncbi:MAG: hypothetical protein WC554_03325 [Clostridia bacterium]|jgi:uncharacterized membrane-anchored protein YitT (DUF2179 family)